MTDNRARVNSALMGRTMDVGGPTIHYTEDGDGDALVLLHGLGFSLYAFRHNCGVLAERHRVFSVDLPGCGYSTLPEGCPATVEAMAGYLRAFLDNLGVEHVALCAAGEGGLYALELASRCPGCISALILSSPGTLTRHFPPVVQLLRMRRLGAWALRRMRPEHVERVLKWCYFNEVDVDRMMVRQVSAPLEDPATAAALLRLLAACGESALRRRLGALRTPVLLVWGENDPGRPCALAQEYRTLLRDTQVRVLRSCGMLPHEEKPREFNEAVLEYLSQVRRRGQAMDDGILTDRFD